MRPVPVLLLITAIRLFSQPSATTLGPSPIIRTFAGTDWTFPNRPIPALDAPLGAPRQMDFDSLGNLYVVDPHNNRVFRIDRNGILTTVAGNGFDAFSGDGGPAVDASLNGANSLTVAPDGTLYIGEYRNRIRKVTTGGIISTFAGTGRSGFSGDGGPATSATFGLLEGSHILAVDAAGNLFVNDRNNRRIRKITPQGIITTFAGNGQRGFSGDGRPAAEASFVGVDGISFDRRGNLYIIDREDNRIRRVDPSGIITTYAGSGRSGFGGDGGPATSAEFNLLFSIAFDAAGVGYLIDGGVIRRIGTDGIIRAFAGSGGGYTSSGDGGPAARAQLYVPCCIAIQSDGGILLSENDTRRIRRIDPSGIIRPFAGNRQYRFSAEGLPATLTFFDAPRRILPLRDGSFAVSDEALQRIRRIKPTGEVVTLAGTGYGFPVEGAPGVIVRAPTGLAEDPSGNLYILDRTDSYPRSVRKLAPSGTISAFAGGGSNNPGDGGPATQAALNEATDIAFDANGNLYIADSGANRIRRVSPNGIISTVAGTGVRGFGGDGGPAVQAQLNNPRCVAVDSKGIVYFCDTGNNRIRRITPDGRISTYAGGAGSFRDGVPATETTFRSPSGIAFDAADNLYVADTSNHRIRVITADGRINNVAGTGQAGFSGDGGLALQARISSPIGVSVDAAGNVYAVEDATFGAGFGRRIRIISKPPVTRFDVAPSTLTFFARAGNAPPAPQTITVRSPITGLPFTAFATTESGGSWLRAIASGPSIPTSVEVTVDPARLSPGSYRGSINMSVPVLGFTDQRIDVSFEVAAAEPAKLVFDAAGLSLPVTRAAEPVSRRLVLSNIGGGQAGFSASALTSTGGDWLSVTPSTGTVSPAAPVSLQVAVTPGTLPTGTYSGNITLTRPDSQETLSIPVSLTVSASGQSLRLTQTGLTFLAVARAGGSGPLSFSVLNTGQGSLPFNVAATTFSGGGWLQATPDSAVSSSTQSPPQVTVSVNHAGLSPGDYYGQIEVASAPADNSPQFVSVVLTVLPESARPAPVVQPAGLVFTGVAGGEDPSSQSILVTNLVSADITFGSSPTTLDSGRWLVYQPSASSVASSVSVGPFRIVVQPSFAGLAAGTYRGAITLVFSDGSISTVGLLLVLAPAPPRNSAAGCAPTRLLPLITSLGINFNVPASFPTPVEATVVDDCGDPHIAGSVVAGFSNGDPPLTLTSLQNGRWAGTWANRDASQRQVTISLSAESTGAAIKGAVQISGGLTGNATPPIIGSGAIVSAASLAAQRPLAPGSMVSLFGQRLSEGVAQATSTPLGTLLAGTQVLVAGRRLPLLYSSDGQVNAILPRATPINARLQLIVRRGNQISVPEEILVAPAQPAIFSRDGSGSGAGHIYVAGPGGTLEVADPARPATAGQVIVIYCAGLGEVDQLVPDTDAAPASVLVRTVNPITVTIGGVQAPVSFAGLAPGFTGLYQINAVVPTGISSGGSVPVVVGVSGQFSSPVTMAVQ